jgi:hypothetical protein
LPTAIKIKEAGNAHWPVSHEEAGPSMIWNFFKTQTGGELQLLDIMLDSLALLSQSR